MGIFNKFNTSYFFAFDNKAIEKVNFPKFLNKAEIYVSHFLLSILALLIAAAPAIPMLFIYSYYYFGKCLSELAQLVSLPYSRGRSTCFSYRLHDFSVTITWRYKNVYVKNLFLRTGRLWISLPTKCLLFTCDLNGFKSRIGIDLLSLE